jgi:dihydroneopterin aldolase
MNRGKITLKGIKFDAFHGVHEEERLKGNAFEVDVTVSTDFTPDALFYDNLEGTLDYEEIYRCVSEEMNISAYLLEHVAYRIAKRLMKEFSQIQDVEIKVSKFKPPIGGPCEKTEVTLMLER